MGRPGVNASHREGGAVAVQETGAFRSLEQNHATQSRQVRDPTDISQFETDVSQFETDISQFYQSPYVLYGDFCMVVFVW